MKFLTHHRVTFITALLTAMMFLVFVFPLDAFAQNTPPNSGPQLGDGTVKPIEPKKGISPTTMVGTYIGNTLLWISSSITWLGGAIMSVSFERLVIGMGDTTMLGGPIGVAIDDMWRIIRDICNLAFIFGFIYAGITIIVKGNDMVTKRMLSQIIIGALLINFSLFFVKLITDVGNYVAVEIWNVLAGGTGNIAVKVTDLMGLSTLWDMGRIQSGDFTNVTNAGNFAFYFMAAIFLIVAGFVFAAGGILIIIRFVMLIFYMIFSPVLFAATVFPSTADVASAMWKKVINYSLFAPAYLLLVLVSVRIGEIFATNVRGNQALSASFSSGSEITAYGVFLNFCVIILFLILSLQIANKFGIAGGERVVNMGNNMRRYAQSAIGRNTIGLASQRILKDYTKINAGAKQSRTGRFVGGALKYGSLGMLDDRTIRGTLEAGTKAKFGGTYSHADDEAYATEQKKRVAATIKQGKFDANFERGWFMSPADVAVLKKTGKLTEDETKTKQKLERAVADASTKQLEELEQEQRLAIISLMTQSQIEALGKSDNLTETEKDALNDARQKLFKDKYGGGINDPRDAQGNITLAPGVDSAESMRDKLAKASPDELMALGDEFLADERHAVRLTNSQMDELKKKMTPTQYGTVDSARKAALTKLAENMNTKIDGKSAENLILTMKPNDMAKLPKEVLLELAPELPTATLIEIAKQSTLNAADQKQIRKNIMDTIEEFTAPGRDYPISAERRQQIEDMNDFLTETPLGKQFGR